MEENPDSLQRIQEVVDVIQGKGAEEWAGKLEELQVQATLLEESGKVFSRTKRKKKMNPRKKMLLGGLVVGVVVTVIIIAVVVISLKTHHSDTEEIPQDTAVTSVLPNRTLGGRPTHSHFTVK